MESPDAHGLPCRVLPHSEPAFAVEAAARQRGVVLGKMVESILLRDRDGRYAVGCVTGGARLNPRAVRTHLPAGRKRLQFAAAEEIQAVIGSLQGAVAPVGPPARVSVLFDPAVGRCEKVSMSSGDPPAGVELDPRHLIRLAGARLAPIARTHSGDPSLQSG